MEGCNFTCKKIIGFEDYLVSNCGNVISLKNGSPRILKASVNNNGYRRVSLRSSGRTSYFLVHRLVALAFIPNIERYPHVRHLNDDKLNNRAENLAWGDDEMNMRDMLLNGINDKSDRRVSSEKIEGVINSFMEGSDVKTISLSYGLNHCTVRKILLNKSYSNIEYSSSYTRRDAFIEYKSRSNLKGEGHPMSTLSEEQIIEIKKRIKRGVSIPSISREYGVSCSHLYSIKNGLRWGHVVVDSE